MPRWTDEDLKRYQLRRVGAERVHPKKPQHPHREGKVGVDEGAAEDGESIQAGLRVTISVYSVRPQDPDNVFMKPLIDQVRRGGYIPDDTPTDIQLTLRQFKVRKKIHERTTVAIEPIQRPG